MTCHSNAKLCKSQTIKAEETKTTSNVWEEAGKLPGLAPQSLTTCPVSLNQITATRSSLNRSQRLRFK